MPSDLEPDPTQEEATDFRARALGFGGNGGNGGGAPYVAKAVHFDNAVMNSTIPLVATDNAFFSMSFWVKVEISTANIRILNTAPSSAETLMRISGATTIMDFYFTSDSGDSYFDLRSSAYDKTLWHHFLLSVDASHIGMAMIAALYIDDVLDTGAIKDADGSAFIHPINGKHIGLLDSQFIGDVSDMCVMPGVSLLDGAGAVPVATRRLFIDGAGKPVDPAVATAVLGVPCILFSGDSTTFVINQGAGGGDFEVSGDVLIDASTSPSG